MKIRTTIFFCCLNIYQLGHSQSIAPVLYFSDITSGPRIGNTDTSLGQVSGQDGAIVTIWGRYLEEATVYCNGAQAAYYYSQSNATQPSDLYSFHRMQMISFQISHLALDGIGSIYAVVGGQQSNTLSFTVRQGNIFFAKTSGDDNSGTGSWTLPWRTIIMAKNSLASGDIVYVCNGVDQTIESDFGACVNLDSDGTPENPKALIVYPGATSRVGNDSFGRAFHNFQPDSDRATTNWVLSRFTITTAEVGIPANTGWRVIGNYITAPNGDGMDGSIDIHGNNVIVLGNELDSVGSLNCDKLYHVIYIKGERRDTAPRSPTETNREVGWNFIHDCLANRAINVYSEQPYSAYIEGHRIHDNVIVNQRGDGIMLGYYVTGNNWIYNNLIIRAGLGPEWISGESYHTGLRINCGHELLTTASVYCYNNTLFGCGWSGAVLSGESGHLLISPEALQYSTSIDFMNNIIFSTGEPYIAEESGLPITGNFSNCWYNYGSPPSWDLTALNADPLFTDTTSLSFQLQSSSPCIDVGQNVSSVVERDLLGIPRPYGLGFELGAYEYNPLTGIETGKENVFIGHYKLRQNYPNPFNSATTINYQLGNDGFVNLKVFNSLGEEISVLVNEEQNKGYHKVEFNSVNLPSGVYFYQLKTGENIATKKMIVLK